MAIVVHQFIVVEMHRGRLKMVDVFTSCSVRIILAVPIE